ncbi:MAG: M20/M25/M40 family metallo-hydrolase [Armatimonadetes bacterium]|nr:M20/M25/M40 family metallo-hydrolase [Armatimonadota bacterium]
MQNRAILTLSLSAISVAGAMAQADPGTVSRIVDEGKNRSQVMNHLKYLTQDIGPRLTGSFSLQRAVEWTAFRFRMYGCDVRIEKWGEVPVGFQRGKNGYGMMVAPYNYRFEYTSPSWTQGTNGPVRGYAVMEPKTLAELKNVQDKLKGAWLLSDSAGGGGRPGAAPAAAPTDEQKKIADAIAAAGIAGRVTGSRNELVLTSGRYQGLKWETLSKDVRVTIRKSDMDTIKYQIEQGRNPQLEFNVDQRFLRGPIPVYNVVAELKGTEKPDEFVIVSGHLDSWDGPNAQGALDNGTGCSVALEAARILHKVGAKPKRSIRFIMWTGEEQGLFGSRAYVEAHKDEILKNCSAVFVDDGGTNYQGGVSCTADMEPMLREAFKPAMEAFPELPMTIRVVERIPRGGGSDHAPFNGIGVPGFFWFETGRSDYNYVHHTQHDRYEMAIPEYLVQSATNSAAASYIVACAPTMLPREKPATPPPSSGGK